MKDILITLKHQHGRPRLGASVVVGLTGLAAGYAEIGGATVGYSTNLGQAPDGGVVWSGTSDPAGPATYGTGAAPSSFAAGDGGTLYLHLTHGGKTYTRAAAIRQATAPALIAAPTLSGEPVEGQTLTGTAATFSGGGVSVTNEWQTSSNGTTGWTGTGVTSMTSPVLTAGQFLRLVSTATNTRGTAQGVSPSSGPVGQAPVAPQIQSVSVGSYTPETGLPITIEASNAAPGDTVFWVVVPAAAATPTAAEILAGQASGGGNPTDAGDGNWPGPFSDVLVPGIPQDSYKLCAVIDGTELSNVAVSASFSIETAVELSLPHDFGVRLFRDSTQYIPEYTDGLHELAAFTGATHHVDAATGNDSVGTGAAGNPYATLAHAIAQAAPFDRIRLAPGVYATPVDPVATSVALERDGSSGTVLIGRFNDLTTAQVDPTDVAPPSGQTQTLWNVDDIAGETFCGFIRLDGATPGGMRGSAQARTNPFCAQYQESGVSCVFYGGTSANFATGTDDPLPALIAGGHIRAWVQEETQPLEISATVYVGPGIVIANNALDAVEVLVNGTLILDRCEVYGGSDGTVSLAALATLRAFGATVGGSNNDNIHYSNGSTGTEIEVKCLWPGHDETDNTSTAHGNAKVLRVNGEYAGGSRCIHDIDTAEIINLGLILRDAWWVDQTLMQIGVGGGDTALLTYGEVTFAGTYTNALVTDPGCTSRRADLTDPWPYP